MIVEVLSALGVTGAVETLVEFGFLAATVGFIYEKFLNRD